MGARQRADCLRERSGGRGYATGWRISHSVSIFDIDSSALIQSEDVRGYYQYTEGTSTERRRVFSPSGNWFAMSTDDRLYVVNDNGGTPRVWLNYFADATEGRQSDLAFSPDEHFLIWHKGIRAVVVDLTQNGTFPARLAVDAMKSPASCSENYLMSPTTFCGTDRFEPTISRSSDSRLIAAPMANGILRTWDFRPLAGAYDTADACPGACGKRYSFQP